MSSDDRGAQAMGAIIAVVISFGLIAGMMIYYGWAVSILWGWFVVPFGLPSLSIPWAIGLASVAKMIISSGKKTSPEGIEEWTAHLLSPLFVVGMCWVVKSFM